MTPRRLGFIGLGKMGNPMTRNLLKQGFPVTVYDVVPEAIERLIPYEASPAGSPREVAERSELVMLMVPADAEVEETLVGPRGVLEGLRPGNVVLQMSTIKPSTIRRLAPVLEARGLRVADAPVSIGGRVEQGGLTVFFGGDRALFELSEPVLRAMATDLFYVGGLGSGQAVKLVNNLLSMTNVAVAAEALLFGLKAGVDPEVLQQVILSGTGASVAWRDRVPQMLRRDFDPTVSFMADLAYKDLSLAVESGNELHTPMMFGSLAKELYNSLRGEGHGRNHFPMVVTVLEKLAGFEAGLPESPAESAPDG